MLSNAEQNQAEVIILFLSYPLNFYQHYQVSFLPQLDDTGRGSTLYVGESHPHASLFKHCAHSPLFYDLLHVVFYLKILLISEKYQTKMCFVVFADFLN